MSIVTNSICTNGQVVNISSGSGAINIGRDGTGKTITIGNTVTGITDAIHIGDGTGTATTGVFICTNASTTAYTIQIGTYNNNFGTGSTSIYGASGGLTLNAYNGGALNIGAKSNAQVITIGNITSSTSVNINTGTGGSTITTTNGVFSVDTGSGAINIGTNSTGVLTIGNNSGASTTNIFGGSGGLYLTGPSSVGNAVYFSGGIGTTPLASTYYNTNFGTTLTLGTPLQNTTPNNLLCNVCVAVTSATSATITMNTGGNNSITATTTVIPSFTVATTTFFTFSVVVAQNQWLVVNTTGTIVVASVTLASSGF